MTPKRRCPKIRSGIGQPRLHKAAQLDDLKAAMREGRFDYAALRARVYGWLFDEVFFLCEGHHRVAAALEIYWEWGDIEPIQKLIDHGLWDRTPPDMDKALPCRRPWLRWLAWLRGRR